MNFSNHHLISIIAKIFPIALITTLGLSSCGSDPNSVKVPKTDGFQQSHGPFDENGNYVEKWADSPPKRRYTSKKPGRSISTVKPKNTKPKTAKVNPKKTYTPTTNASSYTPPQQTYTPPKKAYTPKKTYTPPKKTVKPTPKKVTPKKITPKVKAPIIHRVVKGDTLYGLSRKYKTSITAIQAANNISGSSISLGSNLIIPRK